MTQPGPKRRWTLWIAGATAALILQGCGTVLEPPKLKMMIPKSERLDTELDKTRIAQHALLHGDAAGYAELFAHDENVVLIDAMGGPPLKGWSQISPYLEAQAKIFMEGDAEMELLSSYSKGGRLILTFIENNQVLFAGETEPRYYRLRVTHIMEERNNRWKLIHRHADPLDAKLEIKALKALLPSE